jgi:Leucine-rich repeat (LRR) protein
MTIIIKYSLDIYIAEYKNFIEIQQLPDYDSIVYMNCSSNNLTSLPSKLPESLEELNCSDNNLTVLPSNLPGSLQELWCYNNDLTSLPSNLPESLQILWCSYNKITSLPSNLPESLQLLNCYNNKLTSLPLKLPGSLRVLDCSYNKLTELPSKLPESLYKLYCRNNNLTSLPSNLPGSLRVLDCSYNKLTELPSKLPESLQTLYCSNNKITSLPINLHELRNLTYVDYSNNEIEYIPPQTTRFLNRLKNTGMTQPKLYNDGQNVHDHQIQESIRNSTNSVMAYKPSITIEAMNEEIVCSSVLTEVTKRLLLEYCGDESIHGVMGITFKELLVAVWSIIRDHKDGNEIIGIMNTEMADADCKCFTGKMSRLINCLNGYDHRVVITMAENDQIGNIIIIEKEKLGEEYDIEKHKSNVRLAMEERGYSKETIEEWICYIE